jgi:hypothetical protein
MPAERLGRVGVDPLARRADVAEQRADAVDPGAVGEPDGRQDQQPADQQPPVDEREDRQRPGELHDRPGRVVDHREDELPDAAGVLPQDGRDAAALQLVHPVQRQPDGVLEHPLAVPDLHPLGDAGHLPPAPHAEHDRDDGDDDHRHADPGQQPAGVGRQAEQGRLAGDRLVSSTLSNTSFVPYSGISPSRVETDAVPIAAASVPWCPRSRPQKSRSRARNGRVRWVDLPPSGRRPFFSFSGFSASCFASALADRGADLLAVVDVTAAARLGRWTGRDQPFRHTAILRRTRAGEAAGCPARRRFP